MKRSNNILISGGGTGGHIFPALSIAREIIRRNPGSRIQFVGATGRMEMEKIPAAGFDIKGLWITGIKRKRVLSNLLFPVKLLSSLLRAFFIIRKFHPDVVVGTGGFASGPTLWVASLMKIPVLIQEQNSYPGITNKILSSKASKICVAYEGMDTYFPKDKIILTGNPVRPDLIELPSKKEALDHFELTAEHPVILILGGSLGAATINRTVEENLDFITGKGVDIIWQTGKLYYEQYKKHQSRRVKVMAFIERMDTAYAAADIIISRAGAGTISELALTGKPVLFIPSPNVAEDHQRKNAESVVRKNAALMLTENELDKFRSVISSLIADEKKRKLLGDHFKKIALPDATKHIVDEIDKLLIKRHA